MTFTSRRERPDTVGSDAAAARAKAKTDAGYIVFVGRGLELEMSEMPAYELPGFRLGVPVPASGVRWSEVHQANLCRENERAEGKGGLGRAMW